MFTTILTLNNLITNKPKSIYQDLDLFVFVQHGLYEILTKKHQSPSSTIPQFMGDSFHKFLIPAIRAVNHHNIKLMADIIRPSTTSMSTNSITQPKQLPTPSVNKLNTASIAVPSQPNAPNTTNSTMPATTINMNVNI